MGWERKRGKIEEFNRLLRGATDTSFTVQVGDARPSCRRVRYCITLDTDTRLPRDAARRAHRHHRAPAEPAALRPAARPRRRGLRHPAAARQRDDGERGRLAVRAASTPATPASIRTRRPSPTSTRISSAKASSPARASTTSTRSWPRSTAACRRTRCSRTICSRASTRAPRSSPTSRSSTTIRRACSRTRGASTAGCAATGRSCWWLFPFVPTRAGLRAQPAAAHLALEDPRQPAAQPAARRRPSLLLVARLDGRCPGSPAAWTARRRSPRSRSRSSPSARSSCSAGPRRSSRGASFLRDARSRTLETALRAGRSAARRSSPTTRSRWLHAIALTLVRLGVTQRRLLEWETGRGAARAAARPRGPRRSSSEMVGEPADRRRGAARWSLLVAPARAARSPLPVLVAVGGGAARRLRAQPAGAAAASARSTTADRRVPPRRRARRRGATSTTFVGAERPRAAARQRPGGARADRSRTARRRPTSAWRCSPTLAAHDFGFIDTRRPRRAASTRR